MFNFHYIFIVQLFPRFFAFFVFISFFSYFPSLHIFQHRPGNMDVDPDPSRRFSPVRIPKRFCRRVEVLREDRNVKGIGARDPFRADGWRI